MFINFDPQTGLSINTWRNTGDYGEITDLVEMIQREAACCCDLEGALDALEDGSLWVDDDQSTIEMVHEAITIFQP